MAGSIQTGPIIAQGPVYSPGVSLVLTAEQMVKCHYLVWVRERWDADWIPVDYLQPKELVERALPGSSEATFIYRFGEILREDATAFAQFDALRKRDHYICVQALPDVYGRLPFVLWCGILPAERIQLHASRASGSNVLASGDQELHAYGLDYLLRRRRIYGAWIHDATKTPVKAARVQSQPDFNERGRRGLNRLGNRSTVRIERTVEATDFNSTVIDTVGEKTYGFGEGTDLWSARDILEYLLYFSIDPAKLDGREPVFKLEGDPHLLGSEPGVGPPVTGFLDSLFDVVRQQDRDVLGIIADILDRRRGLGSNVTWSTDAFTFLPEGPVGLNVFSFTDTPVSGGEYIIPANPNSIDVTIDRDMVTADAAIEYDSVSQFDRIVVYGEPVVACFTAEWAGLGGETRFQFDRAWETELQTAYEAATDDERTTAQETYARVFRAFELVNFGWKSLGSNPFALNPVFRADGTVDLANVAPFIPQGVKFLPWLPIASLSEDGSGDADTRLMKPACFLHVSDEGDEESRHPTYCHVEDPPETVSEVAGRFTAYDREGLCSVEFSPNHLLGKDTFAGSSGKTPIFDWRKMLLTVAAEADARPSVTVDLPSPPTSVQVRTLAIRVPDAHFWLVHPLTVVGLFLDGTPRYHASNPVVRDDTARLRAIGAAAAAWYSRTRGRLQFTESEIQLAYPVGHYIFTARNGGRILYVNSVITQRRWNCEAQQTSISTEFAELDFTAV